MNPPSDCTYAATIDDILGANRRIDPHVNRTPVHTCSTIDGMAGRKLHFKCENFQKIGAFKFRGACNAVMKLEEDAARHGVVTHSSGNHAQALALAARIRGIPAHIVMPSNAPGVKRRAVEGYGAIIYECEPNVRSRETTAAEVASRTGATMIEPYNHPDIIAGQGTMSVELLEQVPHLDALVVPVGGGGMLAGVTIAAKAIKPGIRVFAAEPEAADDAFRSKQSGSIEPMENPDTIADGLRTTLGTLTFPVLRDLVEQVLPVSEQEIVSAMRLVWERMKLVIEPSAGVGIAVALSDRFRAIDGMDHVGVVLCGGNVDLDDLPWT